MAWKIGSHDLKTQIQRPHQRHEVFELGAKGVQEYDRRTLTGAKEAELVSENTDALRIQAVHVAKGPSTLIAESVWHSTHRVKLSLLFTN